MNCACFQERPSWNCEGYQGSLDCITGAVVIAAWVAVVVADVVLGETKHRIYCSWERCGIADLIPGVAVSVAVSVAVVDRVAVVVTS